MKISNANVIRLFASFATWGVWTYVPIFARLIGITDTGIALTAAINSLVIFVSMYIFGRFADIIGRRILIIIGLLFSSISFLFYIHATDFTSFLIVRLLSGLSVSIYSSALMAYAHDIGHKLGKFSSFDSLGGAMNILVAGLVAFYLDIISVFVLSAVFVFIAFMLSLRLSRVRFEPIKVPLLPHHILKQNLAVYIPFFIRRSASYAVWVFWGLYLLQFTDNLFLIGVTSAINAMSQFVIMHTLTDKMKVSTLMTLGTLLSAVTFFIYGIATEFWQILPTQILLGISWSFLYVGSIRWITDRTKEKATGVGLFNSFDNLSNLVGPLIALALIPFGGYRLIMYAAAIIAFGSFVAFDILKPR
ncbi:MFS transporter [archaeon]|nr:MAG: MFS transporter [archaeon]